ncbi:DEAD/DEAH box helicase, partial [Candidatus Poribacteria bacterium]|nr:DEAD/DEAH box helicase [Candidatus Poribacteria bacterium]
MDAFQLNERIVEQYSHYVRGFLHIQDPHTFGQVERELLGARPLWPDALIQLNPAYESAETIVDLVGCNILHPQCAEIFRDASGNPLRLRRHQQDAVIRALQRRNVLLTSGTGSGKTLGYLLPIFHSILTDGSPKPSVRAILLYPMNALVNSQYDALRRLEEQFSEQTGKPMPVRFACYTGQEKEDERTRTQQSPPHLLLTNYMMLELMLLRRDEQDFLSENVNIIVVDELHTYRGRLGADMALLMRRVRQRCRNPSLRFIGTSATMASGGTRQERRSVVAGFAQQLFGVEVELGDVVEETLERLIPHDTP